MSWIVNNWEEEWSGKAANIIKELVSNVFEFVNSLLLTHTSWMEEYQQRKMPAVTSVIERQDVVMDAWQMIVADFDAEMADGKETFGRNPTQQSVKEEYSIYIMGALSAGSMVNTLGFWKVRI
jgi:hypothetical protein